MVAKKEAFKGGMDPLKEMGRKIDPIRGTEQNESKKTAQKGAVKETTGLQSELLNDGITAGQIFDAQEKNPNLMSNFLKKDPEGKYIVDFGKNKSAEHNVGLSDIVGEGIQKIRITGEKNGRSYDMVGERKGLKGGFYNEQGRYLPVYSGFKIEILEQLSPEELKNKKAADDRKIEEIIASPRIERFRSQYPAEELKMIVKKAQEYGIDPTFLLALRKTENGRDALAFGIMKAGIDTFAGQLVLACRTIQNNTMKFKRISGKDPSDSDGFTPEFIGFLSNIYAPIGASNDPNNLNKNHFKNLLASYGEYRGKEFNDIDKLVAMNHDFIKSWETKSSNDFIGSTTPDQLIEAAANHLGEEYVWGGQHGNDSDGTDCSGLILMSLKERGVVDHGYGNTAQGFSKLTQQKSPTEVKKGDLVFIKTGEKITHVELALGPIENGEIPVLDARRKGGVKPRMQKVSERVLVGTPSQFYKA